MKKIFFLLLFTSLLFNSVANKVSLLIGDSKKSAIRQQIPRRAEVLFLGSTGTLHNSSKLSPLLSLSLFKSGINITYTVDTNDLNAENLSKYDGLIIYANYNTISPAKEKALKDFVEGGKGLIPLHTASSCFANSAWYIQTVGAQFKSHKKDKFTAKIVNTSHPVMSGISEFETWEDTYVHSNINPDITILQERVDGTIREPWTWVRNQGKGRVFYTAYGHNDTTWTKPDFLKLVENGVLWAVGDKVKEQIVQLNTPLAVYEAAVIPNYEKRNPAPKFQHAFTPEQSMKLMQVPVDFEVKLFAAEPDITNPVAMAWDEKGRLWVIETVDYPNTISKDDGIGDDRIKICEDTDGDGKADKFTVFADNLNIPTSIVFINGGIIISQAPHFVFLKDTNGDDKADIRQNIISGWGKRDTHAGPSNLKYGFDNKIWGVLGYSGFDGTVGSKAMKFSQGVYRFTPDGKNLEYLASTSNNTWGLGFSEENDVFISTANNTHSAYYSMSNQYMKRVLTGLSVQPVKKIDGHYDMHSVTPNLRQVDVFGGFTAAAGHNLYTARNFPKSYWNRIAFISEPTGRVVHNAILERQGSGFSENDGWNLLASSDEWVGPVHAEVGPDGAVWIADWYDFIIQHNPTPSSERGGYQAQNGEGNAYINPLRDTKRGRIYRIVYKEAKKYTPLKLSIKDSKGLLTALENDNMFWRTTAQRLLVESKDQTILSGLYKIINNPKVDEIGLNSPAVHALWTMHGLGVLNGSNKEALDIVIKALSHSAAGVRKAAIEVLPKSLQTLESIQKSGLINDPDLRTRMAAMLVISDMPPSDEMGRLLFQASLKSENGTDELLKQALFAAVITHQKGFLNAYPKKMELADIELKDMNLGQLIFKSLNEEVYKLERRNPILFPPNVAGKEITIKASLDKADIELNGVIMAQGGKENGYGLFIQNGKLNMLVIQNGKRYLASSTGPLPEKFDLLAQLTNGGEITLTINETQVAKAKAPSLFTGPLSEGVRVASDYNNENKIGDYEGVFPFIGNMQNAFLTLKSPVKASAPMNKTAVIKTAQTALKAVPVAKIVIKVVQNVMKFDKTLISVKAGQKVVISFENPDFMQHNLVILMPGTLQKVGEAADALARDPKGAQTDYVPQMQEVLYSSKLLNPDESFILQFTAPSKPGDYPFVCTFPGHWRIMNGIMRVTK